MRLLWQSSSQRPLAKPVLAQGNGEFAFTGSTARLAWKDLGPFSGTGENAGDAGIMAAPCYLIRHGKDWMLWDIRVWAIVSRPRQNGEMRYGGRFTVKRTLKSQLSVSGLKPADILFAALSHLHTDHSGNIGHFSKSTFLIAAIELSRARSKPTPASVDASLIAPLRFAKVWASDDDRDVFGDGTVGILRVPGLTPGHLILFLRLAHAGGVLLSGDLYYSRENYEKRFDSRGKGEPRRFVSAIRSNRKNTHARVVIQDSLADFSSMPTFP